MLLMFFAACCYAATSSRAAGQQNDCIMMARDFAVARFSTENLPEQERPTTWREMFGRIRCGFSDLSYFNRAFQRRFGARPSDVRKADRRDK
jgi:hypothetical protein